MELRQKEASLFQKGCEGMGGFLEVSGGQLWIFGHLEARWEPAGLWAWRRGLGDSDILPHLHPRSEDKSITLAWPLLKERKRKRLNAHLTKDLIYCF